MTTEGENVNLDGIVVCEDKHLPQNLLLEAAERAVAENPENAPSGGVDAKKLIGVDPKALETFGALLTGKKWKNGRTIKIRHLDGDPTIHAKVEKFAKEWEQFANIRFSFVPNGDTDIRISYHLDDRSWSRLGTDALAFSQDVETMHYGWLELDTPDEETRRTVVHEFGHALGMYHEQQSPEVVINWNKPVVYRHYMEQMGWTKADVDHNLFTPSDKAASQFSEYDRLSIMHYPVPPEFTTDGVSVGWNLVMSDTDKRFIASVYPKPAPADVPPPLQDLAPPGAGVQGDRLQKKWGGS